MERNSKIINKKLIWYLIPSILTIFSMQLSSFLDGIIVGNMIGSEALAALAMSTPTLYTVQLPGIVVGTGGVILVGSLLGKRDYKRANRIFSSCLILGVLFSLILTASAFLIVRPITYLLAFDLREYIYQYIFVILLMSPIIIFSFIITSFMNADGNPRVSVAFFIISYIVKAISMIIFIKIYNLGMYGAGLSTGVGYLVGSLAIIKYIKSKRRMLKLEFNLKGSFNHFMDAIKASGTLSIHFVLAMVHMTVVNIVISNLVKSMDDIAIYGVICNMVFVFDLFCGSIYGIVPSICGLYGFESDLKSLRTITRRIYLINLITSIIITALIISLPNAYAKMYGFNNQANLERAILLIRIFVFSFIPYEINRFTMNYYPAINKNMPSYLTVFLRELLLVLPLTLLLVVGDGIKGYVIANVLTEWTTVIITYIFIFMNNHYTMESSGLFMIDNIKYEEFNISINNNVDDAKKASLEIINYCLNNNINNHDSKMISDAINELVSNVINNRDKGFIDISLKIMDSFVVIRLRADGLPFDPTKYEIDNNPSKLINNYNLIERISNKTIYMRSIDLNNTVLYINKAYYK